MKEKKKITSLVRNVEIACQPIEEIAHEQILLFVPRYDKEIQIAWKIGEIHLPSGSIWFFVALIYIESGRTFITHCPAPSRCKEK